MHVMLVYSKICQDNDPNDSKISNEFILIKTNIFFEISLTPIYGGEGGGGLCP